MSNKRERRDFLIENLEIETRDIDGRQVKTLSGHASVFDKESSDLGGFIEIVRKGAFLRSIEENDIHALVNHNSDMVIGRNKSGTLRVFEDEIGLNVEIDLPGTSYANDLCASIERGDITGMSFGFSVRTGGQAWAETDDGKVLRELTDINLFEVSTTPFPAYPDTDVAVRSLNSYRGAQAADKAKSFMMRIEAKKRSLDHL